MSQHATTALDGAALNRHIAAKVWQFLDGDPGSVLLWLQQCGCVITQRIGQAENRQWTLRGPSGHTSALLLPAPDPVAIAVSMGFLLAGMHWPMVLPGLLEAVGKTWKTRSKKAKEGRG